MDALTGGIMSEVNGKLRELSYGQTDLSFPNQGTELPYLRFQYSFASMLNDCKGDSWNEATGRCEDGYRGCSNGLFCLYEYAKDTYNAWTASQDPRAVFGAWTEFDLHCIIVPLVKTLKKIS